MTKLLGVVLVAFIFLFSACSSQEPSKEPSKKSPQESARETPQKLPQETPQKLSQETPKEARVWVPGWKQTSRISIARAGAAVVAENGFIYVMAGVDGKNFLNTTEYARIQEDGSLGPWMPGPKLNEERGFNEAIFKNGYIYIAGGANGSYGSNLLASVERARILPDGSLSPWETEKFGTAIPRRCSKVVEWNNRIYSVGGYGGVMLDSIDRAVILPNGAVGEWAIDKEKMLVPHYVNGVKAKKGALYVFAGHDANKGVGIKDVEWSRISETGELGPWKRTSPLQVGRYGLATASHGDYFYVMGGLTGTEYLYSIERARLKPDGELTPWEFTSPLSTLRATYSVAVYKDWIYAIGGTNREGYPRSVEYASFNDEGDIGFWGTRADEETYKEIIRKRDEAGKSKLLPREGVVRGFLQTSNYTYIQVINKKDGIVWLAAPRVDLKVNTSIRYGNGIFMSNFYSKELERNFPAVFFVGKIQKVR